MWKGPPPSLPSAHVNPNECDHEQDVTQPGERVDVTPHRQGNQRGPDARPVPDARESQENGTGAKSVGKMLAQFETKAEEPTERAKKARRAQQGVR